MKGGKGWSERQHKVSGGLTGTSISMWQVAIAGQRGNIMFLVEELVLVFQSGEWQEVVIEAA